MAKQHATESQVVGVSPSLFESKLHPTPDYFYLGIEGRTQFCLTVSKKDCLPPLAMLSQSDDQLINQTTLTKASWSFHSTHFFRPMLSV